MTFAVISNTNIFQPTGPDFGGFQIKVSVLTFFCGITNSRDFSLPNFWTVSVLSNLTLIFHGHSLHRKKSKNCLQNFRRHYFLKLLCFNRISLSTFGISENFNFCLILSEAYRINRSKINIRFKGFLTQQFILPLVFNNFRNFWATHC